MLKVMFYDTRPASFACVVALNETPSEERSIEQIKLDCAGIGYPPSFRKYKLYFLHLRDFRAGMHALPRGVDAARHLQEHYESLEDAGNDNGYHTYILPRKVDRIRLVMDESVNVDAASVVIQWKFVKTSSDRRSHSNFIEMKDDYGMGGRISSDMREIFIPIALEPDYSLFGMPSSILSRQPVMRILIYDYINPNALGKRAIMNCLIPWRARGIYPWTEELDVPIYMNPEEYVPSNGIYGPDPFFPWFGSWTNTQRDAYARSSEALSVQ